jgi:hypothetical protein
MMWNTNPSTVIPTATAAIGSRTSAVGVHVIGEAMEIVTKTLRVEFQPIEVRPTATRAVAC